MHALLEQINITMPGHIHTRDIRTREYKPEKDNLTVLEQKSPPQCKACIQRTAAFIACKKPHVQPVNQTVCLDQQCLNDPVSLASFPVALASKCWLPHKMLVDSIVLSF